jgi:hypothetical protein
VAIISTAFFSSSDLSTRISHLWAASVITGSFGPGANALWNAIPFPSIPCKNTKIPCHLQHFVLYCPNLDKPALLPSGARRTGQNQEILPPRHEDPPASPKAKPMAGRHEEFILLLFLSSCIRKYGHVFSLVYSFYVCKGLKCLFIPY